MMTAMLNCVMTAAGSRSLYSIVRFQSTANCVHQLVGNMLTPLPTGGSGASVSCGGAIASAASADAAYWSAKASAMARRVASLSASSPSSSVPAGLAQFTRSSSQSAGLASGGQS
jgi:hypothetical protein